MKTIYINDFLVKNFFLKKNFMFSSHMSINFILSTLKKKINYLHSSTKFLGLEYYFLMPYLMRLNSILSLIFEILSFEKTLLPPVKIINSIFFF